MGEPPALCETKAWRHTATRDGAWQESPPRPGRRDVRSPAEEGDPVAGAFLLTPADWVHVCGAGAGRGVQVEVP